MRDDLGPGTPAVHDEAEAVLHFWFVETPAAKWFEEDAALDRTIAARFGAMRDAVLAGDGAGWRDDPTSALAAIVLLDQFSRNIYRGSAEAFAGDALAREIADELIERGWDAGLDATQRKFAYIPFMHAEDLALQDRAVALFEGVGDTEQLPYAKAHREVIARFGRFPSRNAALGRAPTAEEMLFLERGAGW